MSFLVKVEGSESFEVAKECVRSVNVTTDIPLDSNARTKDVGATICKTFYKNEEDATKFYSDMMVRKKENGGKYNEKFLDYQPLESEFDDEE